MNSSERFKAILKRISDTHDKKQADYGTSEDPFANISASTEFGIEPWVGTVLRMNDKMTRIRSFIKNGTLKNESIQDSLLDICVYAAIALVKYEESVEDNYDHLCEWGSHEFNENLLNIYGGPCINCGEDYTELIRLHGKGLA